MSNIHFYWFRSSVRFIPSIVCGCAMFQAIAPLSGQSVGVPQTQVNEWHRRAGPARLESGVPDRLSAGRGKYFDAGIGAPYALDDPGAAAAYAASHQDGGIAEDRYFITNPLPSGESDPVVIAGFSAYTTVLSPSGCHPGRKHH
jgi:hypothetical protein